MWKDAPENCVADWPAGVRTALPITEIPYTNGFGGRLSRLIGVDRVFHETGSCDMAAQTFSDRCGYTAEIHGPFGCHIPLAQRTIFSGGAPARPHKLELVGNAAFRADAPYHGIFCIVELPKQDFILLYNGPLLIRHVSSPPQLGRRRPAQRFASALRLWDSIQI